MGRRPLAAVGSETLAVLVALVRSPALVRRSPGAPAHEGVLAAAHRARTEPAAAEELERRIDEALAPAGPSSVAACSEELRCSALDGDLHGIARILWTGSRRTGAAWRQLEARALRALVLSAVGSTAASLRELAAK